MAKTGYSYNIRTWTNSEEAMWVGIRLRIPEAWVGIVLEVNALDAVLSYCLNHKDAYRLHITL